MKKQQALRHLPRNREVRQGASFCPVTGYKRIIPTALIAAVLSLLLLLGGCAKSQSQLPADEPITQLPSDEIQTAPDPQEPEPAPEESE